MIRSTSFLIVAVLCFGVNADFLRPGLVVTKGRNTVKTVIGTIKENGDSISKERMAKFRRDYFNGLNGNRLNDNEEDVTNKDNLVFPCVNNEITCVRQFLANYSSCKLVSGPAPEPLCIAQNTAFIVSSNITITYSDFEVRGLSGASVNSFYCNKKTGYVILSIMLPNLTVSTPKKHFQYRRPGYESIDRSDCATVTYKKLIFTAEIPGLFEKLHLGLGDIHVYIGDSYPDFYVGPNVYNSTDPTVIEGYATFLKNIPIVAREMLLFQSQLFMATYIQSNLCDFGLNLFSV